MSDVVWWYGYEYRFATLIATLVGYLAPELVLEYCEYYLVCQETA